MGAAIGKIWNAPNTAIGAAYGSVGHAVGEAAHQASKPVRALGEKLGLIDPNSQFGYPRPRIVAADNAVQFRDNPLGGVSAITVGNTSIYAPGKDTPAGVLHEKQHTYQGERLGPFYLPSNLAGGVSALLLDRDEQGLPDWHGPHNWNERGPMSTPPRPWAPRQPRR